MSSPDGRALLVSVWVSAAFPIVSLGWGLLAGSLTIVFDGLYSFASVALSLFAVGALRTRVSGAFRAAVFGANDGLVSNLALVLGVTGGGASTTTVLLTRLAGLLSGALSMGAGEYAIAPTRATGVAHSAGPRR